MILYLILLNNNVVVVSSIVTGFYISRRNIHSKTFSCIIIVLLKCMT